MKHLVLLMLFLPLASSLHARQIIDLSTGQVTNDSVLQVPEKDVEYVGDGIVVTYKIQKAALSEDDLYPGTFNLEIPGFSNCMELRMPGIPMGGDYYIVPKDSEPTVALVSAKYKDLKYELAPARWPMSMSDTVSYSKSNVPVIQPYSGFWPQVVVEELPAGMYRRQPIANAAINPVQYNYDSKTVRVYTEIKYKISFANNKSMADLEFEPGSLLNPNYTLATKALCKTGARSVSTEPIRYPGTSVDADAGYLIISVPEFKETLQEFVKWKKRLGYTVTELYDAAWTPDKIKAAVKQKYDNDTTLKYMLIVGNHNIVRSDSTFRMYITTSGKHYETLITDLPYAYMDGVNDVYPDIYRGRWPIGNKEELQIIIDKTIWFEQKPPRNFKFYRQGSFYSFFEDENQDEYEGSRSVKTCEDVRNYLLTIDDSYTIDRFYNYYYGKTLKCWPRYWHKYLADGTQLPEDLLHENGFNWNYTPSNLIEAVNNGTSFIMFCGHGNFDGWGTKEKIIFNASDVLKMNNYNNFPIVFSMCCYSGMHSNENCFIRSFLRKENGGAVAAFAKTNVGYYNTMGRITSLLFNAIWPEPGLHMVGLDCDIKDYLTSSKLNDYVTNRQLGVILDFAIYGLFPKKYNHNRQVLHCFGDPSLYFRTEYPEILDNYVTVTRISDGVNVRLSDDKNAYIAFYDPISGESVRKYGTEASYFNELNGAKYVDVVVYTSNCVPYMDLGESYDGMIEEGPDTSTRLIGYRDTHNGGVEIDYYMSSSSASQGVTLQVVDLITGNIESTWSLSRDGVVDQKATIGMRCSSGVKVAYLFIGGAPMGNGMKMFVSK